MLFSDRLEVWNPGTPPALAHAGETSPPHGSVPGNPLLAEPLYLTKYIERMGTGTGDMIKLCRKAGLAEPEFSLTDGFVITLRRKPELAFLAVGGVLQPELQSDSRAPNFFTGTKSGPSRDQVIVLSKCLDESDIVLLMASVGRSNRTKFRDQVLNPLLKDGLLTMTVPDKPRSSQQKYRLTEKGKTLLNAVIPKGGKA